MRIYRLHRAARAANDYFGAMDAGGRWNSIGIGSVGELAIRVPSAIVPEEFNVLLNPRNQEYGRLFWRTPQPFGFDERLFVVEPKVL